MPNFSALDAIAGPHLLVNAEFFGIGSRSVASLAREWRIFRYWKLPQGSSCA